MTLPLDPSLSAMVAPIAATLTRRHAALTVDLVFDDAVRDLVDGGFDVALRLGSVAASSLIVRRLASEPEIVVASPAVLDERGVPSSPKDLGGAPWVVHSGLPARSSWTLRTANGGRAQVSVAASVSANTVVALRDLLMAGAGFGVLPLHIVREDLAAGRLQHVCPGWSPRKLVLHALLPTRHAPPRVRLSWTAWPRQRRTWVSIPSSEKADGGHEEHAGCRLPCSRRGGGREMRAVDGALVECFGVTVAGSAVTPPMICTGDLSRSCCDHLPLGELLVASGTRQSTDYRARPRDVPPTRLARFRHRSHAAD